MQKFAASQVPLQELDFEVGVDRVQLLYDLTVFFLFVLLGILEGQDFHLLFPHNHQDIHSCPITTYVVVQLLLDQRQFLSDSDTALHDIIVE
mgnify:CR=1 FL=1